MVSWFSNALLIGVVPLFPVLFNQWLNAYVFGGYRSRLQRRSQRVGSRLKTCYSEGDDEGAFEAQKQLLGVYVKMVAGSLLSAAVMFGVFYYPYQYVLAFFDSVGYVFWKVVGGAILWSVVLGWFYE